MPDVELVCPDAPHELPIAPGDSLPMRTWWRRHGSGWQDSVRLIANVISTSTPFDGIVAFSQGAALSALLHARLQPGLGSFVVCAGGSARSLPSDTFMHTMPSVASMAENPTSPCPLSISPNVRSFHFIGARDTLTPPEDQLGLARCFATMMVHHHTAGHVFPSHATDLDACIAFIRTASNHQPALPGSRRDEPSVCSTARVTDARMAPVTGVSEPSVVLSKDQLAENAQIQDDERCALEAIFASEFELMTASPPQWAISLPPPRPTTAESDKGPILILTLSREYPIDPPRIHIGSLGRALGLSRDRELAVTRFLEAHLQGAARTLTGSQMVLPLIDIAQAWLEQYDPGKEYDGSVAHGLASSQASSTIDTLPQGPEAISLHHHEAIASLGETKAEPSLLLVAEEDLTEAQATQHAEWIAQASTEAATMDFACRGAMTSDPTTSSLLTPQPLSATAVDPASTEGFFAGGSWKFTIGLVGKPSAGKSTFFNAAIDPASAAAAARMAAFPFTTIDPNVGEAFFSSPCPSTTYRLTPPRAPGDTPCDAAYGFSAAGARLVPVMLKDVAGLVPGAYQGRGRGNAFLNDLCDADVLIHVVDASGLTDRGGVEGGEGDPAADVDWVREEIHRWIFNNVRVKWLSIRRRPEKFVEMFSGYHARPAVVAEAIARAGFSLTTITADLPSWTPLVLHRIVAHFLRLRFPILLALNKADAPTADAHIAHLRLRHPCEMTVAVSSVTEYQLCRWRRQGFLSYRPGAGAMEVTDGSPAWKSLDDDQSNKLKTSLAAVQERVLGPIGHTGVLAVLDAAVALRAPFVLFPVSDLDSCTTLAPPTASVEPTATGARGTPAILRHCILVHPGRTVEDVYVSLKRDPVFGLHGEYIRAETRDAAGLHIVLRKDEAITRATQVVRIMVKRRAIWQSKHGVNSNE